MACELFPELSKRDQAIQAVLLEISEAARIVKKCENVPGGTPDDHFAARNKLIGLTVGLRDVKLDMSATAEEVRIPFLSREWSRIGSLGMDVDNQLSGTYIVGPVVEDGDRPMSFRDGTRGRTRVIVRSGNGITEYKIDPGSMRPYDPESAQ